MEIGSIKHRGLRRLIVDDEPRELRSDLVRRIRRIITALVLAPTPEQILGPPGWCIHALTGDRAGTISVSVSGNWRITFEIEDERFITDLDLEDYH